MSLLELLQSGRIDEFNARRGQRVTLDLFAADLANLSLEGVDLNGANLEKADLTGADLTAAALAKANLAEADLTGATLDRVVAIKARLKDAYLGEVRAVEGEFGGADLGGADMTGIHAPRARFGAARLRGAILAKGTLPGANFSEARLIEADLRGAELRDAVLREADLSKANLEGTCLEGADLTRARLAGANLKFAKLTGARLTGADLSGADLTGAELDEAELTGADLTDARLDVESHGLVDVPLPRAHAPVELHFDEPAVAAVDGAWAVLWEHADEDETLSLMTLTSASEDPKPIPVNAEQVVARGLVPHGGAFAVVLFVEKPGGVDLVVHPLGRDGGIGAPRSCRLGYTPVVKPVFVAEGDGILIYGIGRQGALSAHRWSEAGLEEVMRAPAGTYRGFCGRLDPVLLGKGGTVAPVRRDGIGKLQTAPQGYPGRLVAAACGEDDRIALAWAVKGEKGLRVARPGVDVEPLRIDAAAEVGALDLLAVGERWLVVWTREPSSDRDLVLPYAAWFDAGEISKPFPLLGGDDADDVEDVRVVAGGARPTVAVVTLAGPMLVVEVGGTRPEVVCRFG